MSTNPTKFKIASTAKTLFSVLGYEKTSMKMLAKEAEVNEVTIYRHFGTKENLLQFITSSYVEEVNVIDKVKSMQDDKIENVIRMLGRDYVTHCFANKPIYKIQLKLNDDYQDFEKLELTKNFTNAFIYYLDYLKSKKLFLGDAKLYSKAFFPGILGVFTAYVLDEEFVTENEVITVADEYIEIFIRSIK